MGMVKNRNGKDLTEAKDIKKKWQNTQKNIQKDLNDPDNHDAVITHLEPDILAYKVKRALGSFITNKASGGDGIPAELFQILKDDAMKVLYSMSQMWKAQQWSQDWKRSVFIQISKKFQIPKNVQTTIQLHLFHILGRLFSKSFKLGFGSM